MRSLEVRAVQVSPVRIPTGFSAPCREVDLASGLINVEETPYRRGAGRDLILEIVLRVVAIEMGPTRLARRTR